MGCSLTSADLLWQCVSRNNKFYNKRNGIRMSADPFNNTGKATLRHAGFLQAKAAVAKALGAVRPDLADVAFRRARKFAGLVKRTEQVRAARKARSAKKEFKRKNVRKAKKN